MRRLGLVALGYFGLFAVLSVVMVWASGGERR